MTFQDRLRAWAIAGESTRHWRGIFAFNCESQPELALLDALAHRRGSRRAARGLNPDVERIPRLHLHRAWFTSSASISAKRGGLRYARQYEDLLVGGVSCHVGSQLMDL